MKKEFCQEGKLCFKEKNQKKCKKKRKNQNFYQNNAMF